MEYRFLERFVQPCLVWSQYPRVDETAKAVANSGVQLRLRKRGIVSQNIDGQIPNIDWMCEVYGVEQLAGEEVQPTTGSTEPAADLEVEVQPAACGAGVLEEHWVPDDPPGPR